MNKKSILIAHGYWGRGGTEVATMHLVEALKDDFEIYLITRGGWSFKELNEISDTNILETDIKLLYMPIKGLFANTTGGAIWYAFFLRYCRFIGRKYDLRISVARTIGWKLPAVHFLSDVTWNYQLNKRFGENSMHKHWVKRAIFVFGKKLAGKSSYHLHSKDIFVANSQWTAQISKPYTTTSPIVIYPAVIASFKDVDWADRKNEFVCMGRISPEKKIEDSIKIIEQVRASGYNIGLTIFGAFDNSNYSQFIIKLVQDRPWVRTSGPIYGNIKSVTIPTFKYGINACTREAFGISTAELIKAQIIVFVPSEGAQSEIVEENNLIFDNIQDAVNKIIKVLNSEEEQQIIRTHLLKQKQKFSKKDFKKNVLELLSNVN